MTETEYISNCVFDLLDYSTGHGQLLLRTKKNSIINTNLDVIFYGVSFVELFTTLNGLSISLTEEILIQNETVKKYLSYDGNNLFRISSAEENYFVACSFCKVYENDLDHSDSSLNYPDTQRGKIISVLR